MPFALKCAQPSHPARAMEAAARMQPRTVVVQSHPATLGRPPSRAAARQLHDPEPCLHRADRLAQVAPTQYRTQLVRIAVGGAAGGASEYCGSGNVQQQPDRQRTRQAVAAVSPRGVCSSAANKDETARQSTTRNPSNPRSQLVSRHALRDDSHATHPPQPIVLRLQSVRLQHLVLLRPIPLCFSPLLHVRLHALALRYSGRKGRDGWVKYKQR